MKVQGTGNHGTQAAIGVCLATLVLISVVAAADQVQLKAGLGTPVMLADKKQSAYLKVGLTGFEMRGEEGRAPVNVAIVLDKSGSMSGEKIRKAREAAIMALRKLDRNDIVSVITYDSTVHVLVPATKMTDRYAIEAEIERISARGSTALFAGVSKAAREVRKFLDEDRVSRIVLLSDGLANVGPSSAGELGRLGASLIKDGISVTTIGLGLGYNEDLMLQLAMESDGRHYFAEEADDLAHFFKKEFGEVLSVVAQEVAIKIRCARGIRPVRVLRQDADITGQDVVVLMNHIYSGQEKRIVLEVEVPLTAAGKSRDIASVEVSYANMQTKATDRLTSTVSATFTEKRSIVEENIDPDVMTVIVRQRASETYQTALRLRDQGRMKEARERFMENSAFLEEYARKYDSDLLRGDASSNAMAAEHLSERDWAQQRKQSQSDWSLMY